MSQQGARWSVLTAALRTESEPSRNAAYEDALPEPASEATSSWRGVQSKPKGTAPAAWVSTGVVESRPSRTVKTSMEFDTRSVTARRCASRSNRIAAAPLALGLSERVQPGWAASRPCSMRKPATLLLPLLSTYKTRLVAARLT